MKSHVPKEYFFTKSLIYGEGAFYALGSSDTKITVEYNLNKLQGPKYSPVKLRDITFCMMFNTKGGDVNDKLESYAIARVDYPL